MSKRFCKVKDEDLKVSFDDTPELRDAVFEKVISFFEKHESFHGEAIMQSDDPQIYAPQLMADLADDIIKFELKYE